MTTHSSRENAFVQALSTLTLAPERTGQVYPRLCELTEPEFAELTALADSNHVVLRALEPLQTMAGTLDDTDCSPAASRVSGRRNSASPTQCSTFASSLERWKPPDVRSR